MNAMKVKLEEKKKQIRSKLVKKLGIDKTAMIISVIEDYEANLLSESVARDIEMDIKKRLKESEKARETPVATIGVNKRLENLQKKLNMYNVEKGRPFENNVKEEHASLGSQLDVDYERLYYDYISDFIRNHYEGFSDHTDATESFKGLGKNNAAMNFYKIGSQVFKKVSNYDPSEINKNARMSLSSRNIGMGVKSTKAFAEVVSQAKQAKKEATLTTSAKNTDSRVPLHSKTISKTEISKANTAPTKKDGKRMSLTERHDKTANGVAKQRPSLAVENKNAFSSIKLDTKDSDRKIQPVITSGLQPKKYITKLEKFYSGLLTEIKEEADKGQELEEYEYITGNGTER